jgi:hypothetical protein
VLSVIAQPTDLLVITKEEKHKDDDGPLHFEGTYSKLHFGGGGGRGKGEAFSVLLFERVSARRREGEGLSGIIST